jgi:hypothetical protein
LASAVEVSDGIEMAQLNRIVDDLKGSTTGQMIVKLA